ncbi:MAG: peptidoglycan-binding domain-containing protein [Kofleriaceae bacterium]
MPALPPAFAALVAEAALPLDDFAAQPLQALSRAALVMVARQATDLLGPGAGTLLVELGVARDRIRAPVEVAELVASAGLRAVRAGAHTVARGEADRALVFVIQRGLQALAARADAPRELAQPTWGADGAFGAETERAVRGFQAWRGATPTGRFDADDARELEARLALAPAPDLFAVDHEVTLLSKGARRVVEIARGVVAATAAQPFTRRVDGVTYACHAAQFGTAPTPGLLRLPGGVAYGLAGRTYWKCNVFGGAVIALADLPVPTFAAGVYRHFPRAERFGAALASKPGWRLVRHLDHRDPADPYRAVASAANDAAVAALLAATRAGDLLFVDHPGPPGDDGGHTRVCTRPARKGDADVAPLFAQARSDLAREVRDGLAALGGGRETQLWLVRAVV